MIRGKKRSILTIPTINPLELKEDDLKKKLQENLHLFNKKQGAECYYGVPSRRIWNAILSCLIEKGLSLTEASRLASLVYEEGSNQAMQNKWIPEEQIAKTFNLM